MGKKSKPPPPPDYTGLAEKTAASQAEAAAKTTLENRPNQVDIYGNTSTWTVGPDGRPVQTQSLGATGQQQLDTQNQMIGTAQGQVTDALGKPLTTEGMREYGDYDFSKLQGVDAEGLKAGAGMFGMDPMGNSKAIQDATYGLLAPQREMARNAEIQRLKNQGLTEDSPAFQRAMLRQGQADTDAQLKSLLAGQQEYGNQFQRGLSANQLNFGQKSDAEKFAMALRGQQFGEQGADIEQDAGTRAAQLAEATHLRQQPLNELQQLMGMSSGQGPAFGQFMGATGTEGTDYLGAAKDLYGAQVGATNAKNQGKANTASGIASLAGTAAMVFL
jgi:hypothetical protein